MSRNNEVQTTAVNLVCDGTSINGDIEAARDIRIDGFVKGKVIVKGKVVVGPTGKIEGDITCQTIDVSGCIEGNIHVSELISLKSSSLILGNINTAKISVEPGAKFTGTCKMGNEASVKNEKKRLNKLDPEKKKRQLREAAKYSGLAFQMIVIILLVLFAGMQADKYMENEFPGFTALGAFLGVILSLYMVLKDFFKKDS